MKKAFSELIDTIRRNGGLRIWFFAVVALMSIFAFVIVFDEIQESARESADAVHLLDRRILEDVAAHRSEALNQVMTDITALGSFSVTALLTSLFLFALWQSRNFTGLAHLLVLQAGTLVWPRLLKAIIDRPRPSFVPQLARVVDSSFPSGHSFNATALYLSLAFFLGLRFRSLRSEAAFVSLALLIIGLVASSRIYLGVHYPTDVFAGLCAGAAWALIVAIIFIPQYRRARAGRSPKKQSTKSDGPAYK